MKKLTTLCLFLLISTITLAQEKDTISQNNQKKHELKINSTNLIAFKWFDVSYEYLINKESSFGTALLISFNNDNGLDAYKTFSLTPYYRRYFSKNFAKGFFIESFGMLNTYKWLNTYYGAPSTTHSRTNFALGVSAGGKFVTNNGFVAEVYLGLGRNLFNNSNNYYDNEVVGRGGISLGYRF
ncbi:MAG: DUF3575 domain-containing protein [Flavobacteriaceae bacterium]|nr:DUF3575 domain-containing protein [Flavobacteriaceae bacterium]